MLGHGYKSMERKGGRWTVTLDAGGAAKTVEAEAVLIAVGRGPLSPNLGLEKVGVEVERGGFIKVDDSFRTTCPSIYAIGDVIRPPLLAHKASAEGVAAVEIMAGVREPGFDLMSIAGCIYCEPEVATVGLSEAEARERGIEVKVGKFPFRAIGKAVAINQTEGFVKMVASKEYSEVLGCQIIGHQRDRPDFRDRAGQDARSDHGRNRQDRPSASHAVRGDHGGGAGGRGRGDQFLTAQRSTMEGRETYLSVARLGTVEYEAALALQDALVEARRDDRSATRCCCSSIRTSSRWAAAPTSAFCSRRRPEVPMLSRLARRTGDLSRPGTAGRLSDPETRGRDRDVHRYLRRLEQR